MSSEEWDEGLVSRAFAAAADAKKSKKDAEYVAFAEEMKDQMPPEIRDILERGRLVKPSEFEGNPVLENIRLKAELHEAHDAYGAARHVIAALMIQYGTPGPAADEHRIFVSQESRDKVPDCTSMDLANVPDGVILSFVPHQCEITPN